ncbi:hypothetical protein ILUMI_06435 [Ignelater luminosus]|uniref:Mitochondrial ribosomal protein S34 n=1 Tax=Ignelater luminosus TaxID=2038154 RepID=A0A8K0D5E8_IGNLU|nr:hypothetical protein ILUMI_06435 [Ignelater luminosus]
MPIKYIGRTLDYQGKTLWEIVGNLKNFGVGRIVVRSSFERYPEPSYMKIVKVETLPNPEISTPDDVRKVRVFVEKIFRGRKHPALVKIERVSYKADYRLIPKDKEAEYCRSDAPAMQMKILPKTMSFPPLLKELIIREMKASGKEVTEEPQLQIVYRQTRESYYRVTEEGETPNAEVYSGFGKTKSPSLYKNIKL